MVLPEIVAIGIYRSETAAPGRAVSRNRKTTMFEIEVAPEDGGISYIDSERHEIVRDLVVCAKPGQMRHTRFPFRCLYVHMIVPHGQLHDILSDLPNFFVSAHAAQYRSLLESMTAYYDTGLDIDRVRMHSLLLELIYMLSEDSKQCRAAGKMKSNHYEMIEDAVRYIRENLTADLSLEAIARRFSFHPIHFHKCFKASTGKTPREYVEELRINKAANLLVTTDMTLTQIAYECGFSSQSYFSYAFKRKMGMTPRAYEKKIFARYDT